MTNMSMSIHGVTGIELDGIHRKNGHSWRHIYLTTNEGSYEISLFPSGSAEEDLIIKEIKPVSLEEETMEGK